MYEGKSHTLFAKYAVPQMIGLLFNSVYMIVDGVFIGNRLGRDAMAAAAVSVPLLRDGRAVPDRLCRRQPDRKRAECDGASVRNCAVRYGERRHDASDARRAVRSARSGGRYGAPAVPALRGEAGETKRAGGKSAVKGGGAPVSKRASITLF